MYTIIVLHVNNFSRKELKFDTLQERPATKGALIPLIKDDFDLDECSMTVVETLHTLELNDAHIPNHPVITIALNKMQKLKGGFDFDDIPENILPKESRGYHDNLKRLRALRDYALENKLTKLSTILEDIPTNIKSTEVTTLVLRVEELLNRKESTEDVQVESSTTQDDQTLELLTKLNRKVDRLLFHLTDDQKGDDEPKDQDPSFIEVYLKNMSGQLQRIKDALS